MKRTVASGIAGIIASGVAPAHASGTKTDISLEDAQRVHNKCLIIDGHNDTPVKRIARGENPMTWQVRDTVNYHTDIPRMKEGGYDGGFFIVGNGLAANVWVTTVRTLELIDDYPDDLMLVLKSQDIVRAKQEGKIGVILSVEGIAKWLRGKPDVVRMLYRIGTRLVGITHGEGGKGDEFLQGTRSIYGLCTPEDRENDRKNGGGLTPLGHEVLKLNDELGIVTDLSHINDRTFYDVVEHSAHPPIMSHTAVFGLCPHSRNMTDDQIKALSSVGGSMGIAFAPQFIHEDREKATIDLFVEHICYVGDLVGLDYVSIGTDYDGLGGVIPVVPEVSQLVHLTRSMMAHGMTEEEIKKVWGGNFLRILQKTIDG